MLRTYFSMYTLQSLFTWVLFGFLTCEIALNCHPQPAIKLKTMGAIVSHNALQLYIWQAVQARIVALHVCTAPSITHETMTAMLCKWWFVLFIGCYNRSDRGKGKGISLFSVSNPKINPEKKDLAARWLLYSTLGQNGQWKTNHLSGAQRVCHEHFEESCFEDELQTRLGFRWFKHPKPGAVLTISNFDPTQSHVQQDRKERVQKCSKKKATSVTSSCWQTINFSLKGTIKWLRKGER